MVVTHPLTLQPNKGTSHSYRETNWDHWDPTPTPIRTPPTSPRQPQTDRIRHVMVFPKDNNQMRKGPGNQSFLPENNLEETDTINHQVSSPKTSWDRIYLFSIVSSGPWSGDTVRSYGFQASDIRKKRGKKSRKGTTNNTIQVLKNQHTPFWTYLTLMR